MTVKTKRVLYLDVLRALAILSVLLIHTFDGTTFYIVAGDYSPIPSFNWIFAVFINNSFRIGVDLFLILSGALSLGRDWSIKSFLSRRIPRIVAPFLFWGTVLASSLICISYFLNFDFITSFDLMSILTFYYDAFFSNIPAFYPYWFFWMILGTYLIMPVFNKWIKHSSFEEIEYFLVIWLITCIFDFTLFTEFPIKLSYFTSPIGLVVLGYYLRYSDRKIFNSTRIALVLTILPIIVMFIIAYFYSDTASFYRFNRYSIFTTIEVIGVFCLFKNMKPDFLKNPKNRLYKVSLLLAKYSYGIYLVHKPVFVTILAVLLQAGCHYKVLVFGIYFGGLILSIAILYLFDRIPYVKNIIGVK